MHHGAASPLVEEKKLGRLLLIASLATGKSYFAKTIILS